MYEVALIDSVAKSFLLPIGGKYLLENANAAEAIALSDCQTIRIAPVNSQPVKGKAPLIIRAGGIGDLLMLSALLPFLVKKYGSISIAAFTEPLSVLRHLPEHLLGMVKLTQYPVKSNSNYTSITALEGCIESNNESHPIEVMAKALEIELPDKLPLPRYEVTASEKAWAKEQMPVSLKGSMKRRIALQLHASAKIRSLPHNHIRDLVILLIQNNFEVLIFGSKGTWEGDHESIINLTDRGYTFRQSAAIFSLCDAAITPDSAFVHLSAALGIPTVALYGPFHWQQRTAHYPNVLAIQGYAPCAPCHHHTRFGQVMPNDAPCNATGWCAAMQSIEPKRILTALKKQLS